MKVLLSIGTGPGIGFATAERFASEGFHVVLTARNIERTEGLAAQLRDRGYKAEAHKLDAGDVAAVTALIADVERRLGQIDVLHYNAASLRQATLADQPADTFVSDLAVNIGGAMAASKAASPKMIARGEGSIFFTGGFFGLTPNPDFASLSAGKAGIRNLALGLFEGHKDKGVHVATVTVAAFVDAGSKEANDIAEEYWKLYAQPKDAWAAEVTYSG
ncbi:SDR family NAD(P)-dependent oxidoreductase [Agrobacterium tumefaciens]|uniref:SDR family oxidoreductase n=1 Tax=Agrobacterium tumefaciens TaxID=358 RepID=UPI0012B8BEA5|nr:SDR family NAD(P)-dependent oxidoreductase [Agrobacterium tumefaciens]MQB07914.1 SDR family NAD(P)-dependent oxidoreductase [Agrobacterium tumefaciens]